MFHIFHPALLRLASSHLVLFQIRDPCPPLNILAHFSPRVAGQVYGREGRCGQWGEGGGDHWCCPGAGGAQCQWSLVAPRPGLSRPGPRESRERDSYQFRVSWAGLWGSVTSAWTSVTSGDQPQWQRSDLRSGERGQRCQHHRAQGQPSHQR